MENGYTSLHRSRYHCHIALKDGKVFIYDNSGPNPDETDDGPLIVYEDKLKEAGGIKVNAGGTISEFGPSAQIPVRTPVQIGVWSTNIDLEGAIKLGRRLGLRVFMETNIYDPEGKENWE